MISVGVGMVAGIVVGRAEMNIMADHNKRTLVSPESDYIC